MVVPEDRVTGAQAELIVGYRYKVTHVSNKSLQSLTSAKT